MFVNRKVKYKLKRFAWRLLKAIVFFGILFSISISSFASENWVFSSFDEWVSNNGSVDYLLRNSSQQIVKSGTFYGDTSNLNEMILANNYSSSFDSVRMTIKDSPNINVKINSGDTLMLRHQIAVHMANGVINDNYAKKFTVDINYTFDDGFRNGTLSFRFDDALSSYNYIQYDYGVSVFYNVDIETVFSNNIVNGEITSIDYHFYDITSNSYSFQIFPSYNESSIVYYVGSSQNAPIYSPPDDTNVNSYDESEGALLDTYDEGKERLDTIFDSFGSDQGNKQSFFRWIESVSGIFTIFYNNIFGWQWEPLINFLLILGLFNFILVIGTAVVSYINRR